MKNKKIITFIGGLISFSLIIISFIIGTVIFSFSGLKEGQMHLMGQIKDSALNQVIALAGNISDRDPMEPENNYSRKIWTKDKGKRLLKMGEAVLVTGEKENIFEAFFLSTEGNIIASSKFENMQKAFDKKRELENKYNTSFFHRGILLAPKEASARVVPKYFPISYNFFQGGNDKEPSSTSEKGGSVLKVSAFAIAMAGYIDPNIVTPIIDATSPVYGKDGKILGTAHYLLSLMPLISFVDDYLGKTLKNILIAMVVAIVLATLVVVILLFSAQGEPVYIEPDLEMLQTLRKYSSEQNWPITWKDLPPPSYLEDPRFQKDLFHKGKRNIPSNLKSKVEAMAESRMKYHENLASMNKGDAQFKGRKRGMGERNVYYEGLVERKHSFDRDIFEREEERARLNRANRTRNFGPMTTGEEIDLDKIPDAIPIDEK